MTSQNQVLRSHRIEISDLTICWGSELLRIRKISHCALRNSLCNMGGSTADHRIVDLTDHTREAQPYYETTNSVSVAG